MDYGPKPARRQPRDCCTAGAAKAAIIGRYCPAGGTVAAALPRRGCGTGPGRSRGPPPRRTVGAPSRRRASSSRHHRRAGARHRSRRRHAGVRRAARPIRWSRARRQPVCCSTSDSPRLTTCCRAASDRHDSDATRPTSRRSRAPHDSYALAAGQDELRVPLTWTDGNGVTVTKTFVFRRSMYAHRPRVLGAQRSAQRRGRRASYAQHLRASIRRSSTRCSRSRVFRVSRTGDLRPGGKKYQQAEHREVRRPEPHSDVKNGWLAGMQHHFVSAIVPNPPATYSFSLQAKAANTCSARSGPLDDRGARRHRRCSRKQLFVGPKLQKQLVTLHPELDHVADYGVLTFLRGRCSCC